MLKYFFLSEIESSVHISVETLHIIIISFKIDLFLFSFLLYSIGCWVPKLRCASFAPVSTFLPSCSLLLHPVWFFGATTTTTTTATTTATAEHTNRFP